MTTPFKGFYGATAIYLLAIGSIAGHIISSGDFNWINFAVAGFFTILYVIIWVSQKT